MKLLVVSDIHGSLFYTKKMVEIMEKEEVDKVILLGDLYYHGPRNPLPEEYNPMEVSKILNGLKEKLICIKGNCDAEVDEMISEFKFNDHVKLEINNKKFMFTHGHKFNIKNKVEDVDVLVYGHFHTGYIKQDNHIYEFSILNNEMKVDTTIDYSASIKLPGCGSFMHAGDDLQYLSHFDDGLYTFGNYDKLSVAGEDCYKVINASLSSKLFNYFFGTPEAILNTGVGIKFSNSDDPYDTRVTFIASFVASDGSYQASVSYTYYDIGNSSHPVVEAYLNGGN